MTKTVTINGVSELCELVRDCAQSGTTIVDYGSFHKGLGNPPPSDHVEISQQGGIIEHYKDDLAVRVKAGTRLGDLQKVLAQSNQFLPIDADDEMTIGEIINHNVYGPLRTSYGSVRDLLLGLRFVDRSGDDNHVGGRVVKNVAGYDVTRFMTGGLGEFGIIYEATLRTYAIPAAARHVRFLISDANHFSKQIAELFLDDAAPGWIMQSAKDGQINVNIGYLGSDAKCEAQFNALKNWLTSHLIESDETASGDFDSDQRLREQLYQWRRKCNLLAKVIVPPAACSEVIEMLSALSKQIDGLTVDALPLHGCIHFGANGDAAAVTLLDQTIGEVISRTDGLCAWHALPDGCDHVIPFSPAQTDLQMLTKLKFTLDPHALFNPGRYVPVSFATQ